MTSHSNIAPFNSECVECFTPPRDLNARQRVKLNFLNPSSGTTKYPTGAQSRKIKDNLWLKYYQITLNTNPHHKDKCLWNEWK